MIKKTLYLLTIAIIGLLSSCDNTSDSLERTDKYHGEYIYRHSDEFLFKSELPQHNPAPSYPWENKGEGSYPKITKDYFRCKGSSLNPFKTFMRKDQTEHLFDCGGAEKHSLPLRDNKEFVYPILIDLLNYIQDKTKKRVVITSGHRCPAHNSYVDPSSENQYSKHMIAAEVSFYVQGLENKPEAVIQIIQDYYQDQPKYKGLKEYLPFTRYEKSDTNVITPPWMNKEVFIKLFKKDEGRNFDNRHPYPYLSIQVRYDFDKQAKVTYTWDKAHHNYMRN